MMNPPGKAAALNHKFSLERKMDKFSDFAKTEQDIAKTLGLELR